MSNDQLMTRIERWIRPDIQKQKAYPVPSAAGLIKLDAMENPYTWPDAVREEWLNTLREVAVNRYPSANAEALRERLRAYYGLDPAYDLLLGNGSDEIIQMVMAAVAEPGRTIMAPAPSFVVFGMIARLLHLNFRTVDLDAGFNLDMSAMLRAIEADNPAVIFLAQPNNPTGNLWGAEQVRTLIEATSGLVVIDEAYTAFTEADYLHLLDDYDNVLIMRTLSKEGLAGLRLGVLMGQPAWLHEINKVRLPYNVNVLTQVSAAFALQHAEVFAGQTRQIRESRTQLQAELAALPGVELFPSEANFLLLRTPTGQARQWFDGLHAAGVLIKCMDGAHPLLQDCLRVTVGTPEENQALIAAMHKVAHGMGKD